MKRKRKLLVFIMLLALCLPQEAGVYAAQEKINITGYPLSGFDKEYVGSVTGKTFTGTTDKLFINGKTAFCIQSGYGITGFKPEGGDVNLLYNVENISSSESKQNKIAYLGWYSSKNKTDKDYAFTQMYLWQSLPDMPSSGNATVKFVSEALNDEYKVWKKKIDEKINSWSVRPSFAGRSSGSINIEAGETKDITDINGVLKDYKTFKYKSDGITVSHEAGKNVLRIKADKDVTSESVFMSESSLRSAGCQKYESSAAGSYVYNNSTSQNMATYGFVEPICMELRFDVSIVKGKIAVKKTKAPDAASEDATPERGAEFRIYLKEAGSYGKAQEEYRDTIVTDESGYGISKSLPHGKYTVHQTKGAEGHVLMDDFDAVITTDSNEKTYTYNIKNETLKSNVRIIKKDAESGKTIPRAGAEFELFNMTSGEKIKGTGEDGCFVTDMNGIIELPFSLYYGDYRLVEKKAPEKYVLAEPLEFTVDGKEELLMVEVFDTAQKGVIKLYKKGDILQSVKQESDGTYDFIFGEAGLSGAEFEVLADEDIITPDGTIRAKKGDLVETMITDEKGYAESEEQYLGKYKIREIKAPYGYVQDHEEYAAELTYSGQEIEITDLSVEVKNERQKAKIRFHKLIEEDLLFGIESGDAYKDIKFGLFAGETITAADGSTVPAGGMIETAGLQKASEDGNVYCGEFMLDLPFAEYYVKEIEADEGYVINDTEYPVEFAYGGQESNMTEIDVNEGKVVHNNLIRGEIAVCKIGEEKEPVEGALFGLFSSEHGDFTAETAVMTALTDEEGQVVFKDIPYGQWIIHEIEAAPGYALSEKDFHVSIIKDKTKVRLDAVNKKIKVEVSKIDAETEKNIAGAVLQILDTGGNVIAEWISGEIPHLIEKLEPGDYICHEKAAPSGYAVTDDIKFTVEDTEEIQRVEMADDVIRVSIAKVKENGKPLAGAVLQLLDLDGKVIDEWISEKAPHIISKLPVGKYYIHEVKCPEGYGMSGDIKINVEDTKALQKFEFSNVLLPKTGDNSSLIPLIALMFISFALIRGLAFVKKKTNDM